MSMLMRFRLSIILSSILIVSPTSCLLILNNQPLTLPLHYISRIPFFWIWKWPFNEHSCEVSTLYDAFFNPYFLPTPSTPCIIYKHITRILLYIVTYTHVFIWIQKEVNTHSYLYFSYLLPRHSQSNRLFFFFYWLSCLKHRWGFLTHLEYDPNHYPLL